MKWNDLTKQNTKVMFRTHDKRVMKFHKVELEKGRYYGVNRKKKKRILIFENDIQSIKLRDKKASTRLTILVSTLGIGLLYLMAHIATGAQKL